MWYVLRDLKRPNSLTPAWRELPKSGIECFTPMIEKLVNRGGKTIRELRPVVGDILFAKADKELLDRVVGKIPTLQYRFLRGGEQGAVMTVADEDMERFIRLTGQRDSIVRYFQPGEITPDMYGREVIIIGGAFDGQRVTLLKRKGLRKKSIIVEIPGLLTAVAELSPDYVELK